MLIYFPYTRLLTEEKTVHCLVKNMRFYMILYEIASSVYTQSTPCTAESLRTKKIYSKSTSTLRYTGTPKKFVQVSLSLMGNFENGIIYCYKLNIYLQKPH